MKQEVNGQHFNDDAGNPAGGTTTGTGINITWQNAVRHLKLALAACESRTAKREQRAVEGTHTP